MKQKKRAVVVTTQRGVFFGYSDAGIEEQHVRLDNARMVVYWSADCRSVVGLGATGPSAACKISPSVPAIIIRDVTSVIECSDEAITKFELGPWAK